MALLVDVQKWLSCPGGAATVETGAQAGAQAGEGEGAGAVDNSLRCLLCRITAPSLEHLQYHLA